MPRLKRDVEPLIDRAIESMTLAIELFNRPSELGRIHAVPMLLHHAFEMLLKATILQRTGRVHEKKNRYSYGFDKCLALAEGKLKVITSDEKKTLSILDAARDTAAHYYADLSEDILYVHAQSAVTLFASLLHRVFNIDLVTRMPSRVLPVSARPPTDLLLLLERELLEVDALLANGKRRTARAAAKLRALFAFATASRDAAQRVTEVELADAVERRRSGEGWDLILPEITQLRLATSGSGVPITMKITKDGTIPVRIARPGEESVGIVVKQEVNPFDKFNLNLQDLADKLALTSPKTLALIYELEIQADRESFRELVIGAVRWKRYSKKALDQLRQAIADNIDLGAVWARQKYRLGAPVRKQTEPLQ